MIKIINKNVFDSDAHIIAHQVNIEGLMGAGIAKTIKAKFPSVYSRYHTACSKVRNRSELMGKIQLLKEKNKIIANLFAESLNKNIDGNRKTDYDALRCCLQKLNNSCKGHKIAIPYKIGCGLGGGDWNIVSNIIKEECRDIDVEICSLEQIDEQILSDETTTDLLLEYFKESDSFSTAKAQEIIKKYNNVPEESIRARIYEGLKKGLFSKITRGVYSVTNKNGNTTLIVNGDGRDLSFVEDNSIDCIITDHPWDDNANKGGNRNFAEYDCFKYNQHDFDEKARVLKDGCFLVELLPDENATNFDYLHEIKIMAQKAGFEYYAKVPYIKGDFVANTGRKSKNSEDVMIFSKGKARALKLDTKKNKALAKEHGLNYKLSGDDLHKELQNNGIVPAYFSGTNGMLPTSFNFQSPAKKEKIHQSEKPVGLIETLLDYLTLENEMVLDQFAGSGVVGEACLSKNRNCILVEMDEKMYNAIYERLGKIW